MHVHCVISIFSYNPLSKYHIQNPNGPNVLNVLLAQINLWLNTSLVAQKARFMSICPWCSTSCCRFSVYRYMHSCRNAKVVSHRLFWLKPGVTSVLLIFVKPTGGSIFKLRLYFGNSGSILLVFKRLYFIDPNGGLGRRTVWWMMTM